MQIQMQDLLYSVRMLWKTPGFTLIIVLMLALGTGANTAIFTVVNAVLLRPLPYRAPEELTLARHLEKTRGTISESVSYADFLDWQAQNHVFTDLAIFRGSNFTLATGGDLEEVAGANVSANFFQLLGVNALRGRTFLHTEGARDSARVTLLSYTLWQKVFGADEKLVGQQIRLDDQLFTVVGILPPEFKFPFKLEKAEIWTTISFLPEGMMGRSVRNFQAIGRLKSGVSLQTAQADMTDIAGRLEQENSGTNRNLGVILAPAHRELTKDVNLMLWLLFGAAIFVLLIACVNVANLLLARALSRRKEMAIRSALGASGWQIVRQLLTEGLFLSLASGSLGLLLAAWGVPLLLALSPQNLPRVNVIALNGQVLGYTLLVSILTGVLFGLAPVFRITRPNLINSLKEDIKTSAASASRSWLRAALVISEIAVALMLLVGAGLLINSFIRLNQVQLGFTPEKMLIAQLSFPPRKYPSGNERLIFLQQVQERIRNMPGVRSVSFASSTPFSGSVISGFTIKGRPWSANEKVRLAGLFTVTPDYLMMMGIPLLQGRQFAETDDKSSRGVLIINETFARQFFPNESPLGQVITPLANRDKDSPAEFEVVGIVGNVRGEALDKEPRPEIYTPYRQTPWTYGQLAIRTEHSALSFTNAVQKQIRSLDPDQVVSNPTTVETLISRSILSQRFNLLLLSIFAGIGLVLTLGGIYGVISYLVTENTREIGIRVALGAQRNDILKLVLGRGLVWIVTGVIIGIAGAFGLTRLMASLLFGVKVTDPLTFAIVAGLFGLVALLACYLPARRAAKVDPIITLRYE